MFLICSKSKNIEKKEKKKTNILMEQEVFSNVLEMKNNKSLLYEIEM
jgi:hypothetical protein